MLRRWPRFVGTERRIFVLICLGGLFFATGSGAQIASTREVMISAAVSLKNAFEDIGKIFRGRNPGIKLLFNFGGSGDLARQIEAGAPVDVFAPAAQNEMDDIDRKGLVAANSRRDFTANALVLVKPAGSNIPLRSFHDLQRAEVKKIVIGNPKTVPAGRYAKEVLRYLHLWSGVQDKLIFADHARQALDYVARNEVDAGIVYSTDAMVRSKELTPVIPAPEGSHAPILYPIAVLKGTRDEKGARKWVEFMQSAEAQKILRKYGFTPASR